uniref:basic salivary proline-rich protein 2-like n=1 Tax=Agelaius phoeniceus TaxID=39638 RepID=UPI0023EDF2A8|nr:basic salivary proline-rich protein 2-like [Agelaius phoeniceus]
MCIPLDPPPPHRHPAPERQHPCGDPQPGYRTLPDPQLPHGSLGTLGWSHRLLAELPASPIGPTSSSGHRGHSPADPPDSSAGIPLRASPRRPAGPHCGYPPPEPTAGAWTSPARTHAPSLDIPLRTHCRSPGTPRRSPLPNRGTPACPTAGQPRHSPPACPRSGAAPAARLQRSAPALSPRRGRGRRPPPPPPRSVPAPPRTGPGSGLRRRQQHRAAPLPRRAGRRLRAAGLRGARTGQGPPPPPALPARPGPRRGKRLGCAGDTRVNVSHPCSPLKPVSDPKQGRVELRVFWGSQSPAGSIPRSGRKGVKQSTP